MSESTSQPASASVTITVGADGPLEVVGPVEIIAADGTVLRETSKAYLCRCGHSANKPFCDGAHKREGFADAGLGS
jgi:CDGSH-type Zn-finger protein